MCNTDAEGAQVIRGLADALGEANRRLSWIRTFNECMASRHNARRCNRETGQ